VARAVFLGAEPSAPPFEALRVEPRGAGETDEGTSSGEGGSFLSPSEPSLIHEFTLYIRRMLTQAAIERDRARLGLTNRHSLRGALLLPPAARLHELLYPPPSPAWCPRFARLLLQATHLRTVRVGVVTQCEACRRTHMAGRGTIVALQVHRAPLAAESSPRRHQRLTMRLGEHCARRAAAWHLRRQMPQRLYREAATKVGNLGVLALQGAFIYSIFRYS
jgi:hypothetical protein